LEANGKAGSVIPAGSGIADEKGPDDSSSPGGAAAGGAAAAAAKPSGSGQAGAGAAAALPFLGLGLGKKVLPGKMVKEKTLLNCPPDLSPDDTAMWKVDAYIQMDLPVVAMMGERTSDALVSMAKFVSKTVATQNTLGEQCFKDVIEKCQNIRMAVELGRDLTVGKINVVTGELLDAYVFYSLPWLGGPVRGQAPLGLPSSNTSTQECISDAGSHAS
jgi:hypothetical protein